MWLTLQGKFPYQIMHCLQYDIAQKITNAALQNIHDHQELGVKKLKALLSLAFAFLFYLVFPFFCYFVLFFYLFIYLFFVVVFVSINTVDKGQGGATVNRN